MKEQIQTEDYKSFEGESELISQRNTQQLKPNLKASLNALMYKSAILQSRYWCSNICQIITPIICLLFTIFVRIIVQGITTGAIQTYNFPQPFNLPVYNSALKQSLNLSCSQIIYYQNEGGLNKTVQQILALQLKDYCYQTEQLNPSFIQKSSVNTALMEQLKKADTTAFERGDDLRTQIPDSLIQFKKANSKNLQAVLSINDFRLPEYHKNNGMTKILIKTSTTSVIGTYLRVTEGMMTLIDKITRPYLQSSNKNQKQIITGSYMYMPFQGTDNTLIDKVVNVIGSGLYPLGMSLLMPILLYMVVSQKEEKQIQIMKMNGLDSKHYWVNFFIISFLLSMITSLNMYFFGTYIIDITFFTQTSASLIWIVFAGWAIAQISMTSFVQIFINNSRTATIVGYLLSIFSTLLGEVISTIIYPLPMTFPFALLLYPPFALCRIIYYIGWACSNTTGCYRSIAGLQSQPTIAIIVLFSWFLVYLFSIWLNDIVQQQYGVAKKPKLVQNCLKYFRKNRESHELQEQLEMAAPGSRSANDIQLSEMQANELIRKDEIVDQSVFIHREQVLQRNTFQLDDALIVRDISKKYTSDNGQINKIALKPLTMRLIKGEIFGFLGPNGAGKTTLISVLTGMYPQTSGVGFIGGRQIGLASTNQLIGVCPQFDILWSELTVQQHIEFYCRLKQVKKQKISQRIQQLLKEVDLQAQKSYRVRQLSGGMQRRLSIACALSGNPSIVILDQPTSGLDPYHRRQIWKILQRCKRKTSMFMTSHLMDEVQHLCDRIGIISQGQLRCIGDLRTLKDKFGKGYRLTIGFPALLRSEVSGSGTPTVVSQLIKRMKLEVVNELQTRVVLKIDRKDIRECIQQLKKEQNLDWFINQPSLYDVFMHFVK